MKAGKSMDLVIMREATEGFYPDRNMARGWGEMMPNPDMAISVRKITRGTAASASPAVRSGLAMTRRKKVTAIHKANSFHADRRPVPRMRAQVATEFPQSGLRRSAGRCPTATLCATRSVSTCWWPRTSTATSSDLASELSGSLGLAGSVMAGDTLCCAQAAARLSAGYREPGQGEPDVDDPVGRDAARMARQEP